MTDSGKRRSLTVSTIILCFRIWAYAQVEAGWVQGRVTNKTTSTGIEDIEVVLTNTAQGELLRSKTGGSGEFLLMGVPSGEYELRFRKEGFPEYVVHVRVQAGCNSVIEGQMAGEGSQVSSRIIAQWQRPVELWSCQVDRFGRTSMDNFPVARNIWNLLQTQHPPAVTETIDEGGFQTGVVQLIGVHGGTWTQNSYRWDGMNITNPYEPGKPLAYPTIGTLEELDVESTFHPAEIPAAGAEFGMISRRGGERFHGQAETYYLGDPFQSSNLDQRLRSFGFQTTPHFKRFPEAEFSFGGRVPLWQQWSYFASFGIQHLSRVIPDFATVPATTVSGGLLRLDGSVGPKDQLAGAISGQIVKNSNLGARPGLDPLATLLGNDRFELLQGHWLHRHSDRSISELSFGFSHSSPTDTLQHGVTTPSCTQLFTGKIRGSAPLESDSALSRFSLLGQMQSFRSSGRWRHQLRAGVDLEESLATEELRVYNGLQLFLFPGTSPAEVAEFNSPSHAMQRLREFSFFAEDGLQLGNEIFIRAGFNLNSSNAFLPKQVSGAGVFAPQRVFAGADHVVHWTTISPRSKIVVPFRSRLGTTRIIAGFSRYYHLLPASYADFANPNALSGALYRWNDRDQDGVFQRGEEGTLLRVFGGHYSSVDPNIKRPFTDEWGVALEHDFGRRIQTGARLLQRDSKRLVHTVNVGVPPSAYTPVTVLDPGDDGIPGTSDDRLLTVFNQDPRTLGQDRYLLTNPAGVSTTYKGVETNVTARFPDQGFVSISFTAYKSVGESNPGNSVFENDATVVGTRFDSPNTTRNARGRLFFDRAYLARIAAHEQIPFGIQLSSVVAYFDGLPFGRKLIIPDLNQGPFFVMATPRGKPGGVRTEFNMNFDQRVSREFKLRSTRLSLILDTFNLLNLNRNLREFDITGPLFAKRKPTEVENPRVFRIAAKLSF